jgi:hypothetical protein
MRRIFAVLAAHAIISFGPTVFAADGDATVEKGSIAIYDAAKLSMDMMDTGGNGNRQDEEFERF